MADFTVIMQAKKDLYFKPAKGFDGRPVLFMAKDDLRVMFGQVTTRYGYAPVEHNDKNFRFFIPADQLGLGIKDVR